MHILVNSACVDLVLPIYGISSATVSSKEGQMEQFRSALFSAFASPDNKMPSHPHCYLELPVKQATMILLNLR